MRGSLWLLLCLCCTLPVWGSGSTAYQQRLARADSLLAQAERQPARAAKLVREAGTLVPREQCPGLQLAMANPKVGSIAQARHEVQALRQAASLHPTTGSITPNEARAKLGAVLARNEFHTIRATKAPKGIVAVARKMIDAWSAFWRAAGRGIERIFRWIAHLFPERKASHRSNWWHSLATGLRYTLFALLCAAVLFLIGLLISKWLAVQHGRIDTRELVDDADNNPALRRKQEPTFWERSLRQAEELWQRGEQRDALRTLHRACLVLLDARGLLRLDETRANGEMLRELRRQGNSEVCHALTPIVSIFERSWYGFLDVPGDEFQRVVESSRHFRESVVKGA